MGRCRFNDDARGKLCGLVDRFSFRNPSDVPQNDSFQNVTRERIPVKVP